MFFELITPSLKMFRKREKETECQFKIGSKNRLKYILKTVLVVFRRKIL